MGNAVNSLALSAATDDPRALMLVNGAVMSNGDSKTINLNDGENSIDIMAVTQNASTKTYILDELTNDPGANPLIL